MFGKTSQRLVIALGLTLIAAPAAMAGVYELRAGEWQITDGVSVGPSGTPASVRTICIRPGNTRVSDSWFTDFAKPTPDCTTQMTSSNNNSLDFNMSCPNPNGEISGPTHVTVAPGAFTIDSKLSMDLGGYPLPMNRSLTARVVGACN